MDTAPKPSIMDLWTASVEATPPVEAVAPEATEPDVAEPEVTPAEVVIEAPKEVVPETPKEDLSSKRFAALSRREKEFRQKQDDLKRREVDMTRQLKDAEERLKLATERESKFARLKDKPLSVLKEAGLSYEELTRRVLEGEQPDEVDPFDAKLSPIEAKLAKLDELEKWKESVERQQQQFKYDQAERELHTTVENSVKNYELITVFGEAGIQQVKDVMTKYFEQYNKLLAPEDACRYVEETYEEAYIAKLANTSKFKKYIQPEPQPEPSNPIKKDAKAGSPTLTNSQASVGASKPDLNSMNAKDRLNYLASQIKYFKS